MQTPTRSQIPAVPLADLRAKLSRIEKDLGKLKTDSKKSKESELPPETWPVTMKSPFAG